jgi:hypothetical protein
MSMNEFLMIWFTIGFISYCILLVLEYTRKSKDITLGDLTIWLVLFTCLGGITLGILIDTCFEFEAIISIVVFKNKNKKK